MKEKEIDGARLALRHHIGMSVDGTEPTPRKAVVFFVELSPYSSRGLSASTLPVPSSSKALGHLLKIKRDLIELLFSRELGCA